MVRDVQLASTRNTQGPKLLGKWVCHRRMERCMWCKSLIETHFSSSGEIDELIREYQIASLDFFS